MKLDWMILTVQRASTSIGMALGLNKCAISGGSNTGRAPQAWAVDGILYLDRDMTYKVPRNKTALQTRRYQGNL